MDKNTETIIEKRIERTVEALKQNCFDAHFIKSRQDLMARIAEYLPAGKSCSVGGSMTLFESGVMEYIEGRQDITYYDRYAKGADVEAVFHHALSCDVYITSANAITEDGCLYNVDGRGNRVSALIYGPKKVLVISGYNKIVKDIEEAKARKKSIAAPANVVRLGLEAPCGKVGYCVDCKSDARICCFEAVCHKQTVKDRIAVLILPEQFGY